jgi:ribosomal silencing factor RsfS
LCGRENRDSASPIIRELKLGIVTLDSNKGEDFTPLKVNDHTKLSDHILLISTRSSVPSTNTSVTCKSKAKIELTQKIQNIKKMNIFFIIKL